MTKKISYIIDPYNKTELELRKKQRKTSKGLDNIPGLEERLTEHARESGFGNVVIGIRKGILYAMLHCDNNVQAGNNLRTYYKLCRNNLGQEFVYDASGSLTDGKFYSTDMIQKCLWLARISEDDYQKLTGQDPEKGLMLVDGYVPNRTRGLYVQVHEMTHARDFLNGLEDSEYGKPRNRKAFEVLTDLRSFIAGFSLCPDSFLYRGHQDSGYIRLGESVTDFLREIVAEAGDPRTNMGDALRILREKYRDSRFGWAGDLFLSAPAFKGFSLIKRNCSIEYALDRLIDLEDNSTCAPVIPFEISAIPFACRDLNLPINPKIKNSITYNPEILYSQFLRMDFSKDYFHGKIYQNSGREKTNDKNKIS